MTRAEVIRIVTLMTDTQPKTTRGGARQGAGRPSRLGTRAVLVKIRASDANLAAIVEQMTPDERAEACVTWLAAKQAELSSNP